MSLTDTLLEKNVLPDALIRFGIRQRLAATLREKRPEDVEARQAGVNGVPYFIFNNRTAVSGAHEPEALLQAMMESLKD